MPRSLARIAVVGLLLSWALLSLLLFYVPVLQTRWMDEERELVGAQIFMLNVSGWARGESGPGQSVPGAVWIGAVLLLLSCGLLWCIGRSRRHPAPQR